MNYRKAYFAGGCFWCITPTFKEVDGVIDVYSGYSGGHVINPTYEQVKSQETGHRETIEVIYDSTKVDYLTLLNIFLNSVDLFDSGGQFIDRGLSYTLAIFYNDLNEKELISNQLKQIEKEIGKTPCVEVIEFTKFYLAEEYHQDYYLKHPKEFEEELISSGRKQ